jgi:CNT family concentrative nucleoside transporter
MQNIALSVLAMLMLTGVAWLISEHRKHFPWRIVAWGFASQIALAFAIFSFPATAQIFSGIGQAVTVFLNFSQKGAMFLFSGLANPKASGFGMVFAFTILPTVIFFSSFMAIMYHFGIMQRIVYWAGWLMSKTFGTSGIESLTAAANVFFGQTEALLVVRPYLHQASRSELNAMMVGGFVTISGAVLGGFIQMGIPATSLIAASILSAPAGLMMAKIVIPELSKTLSIDELEVGSVFRKGSNVLESAVIGAGDGARLALNIGVMLIAVISLVAGLDFALGALSAKLSELGITGVPASLGELFALAFYPVAWVFGFAGAEAAAFAKMLGIKVAVNEFLSYAQMLELVKQGVLSKKAELLLSVGMCGFANLGSIAIQIGGIGALAPNQRAVVASIGLKAMAVGMLGNIFTAAVVNLFV